MQRKDQNAVSLWVLPEMIMSRIHKYTSKGTWMHNTNTDASKDTQF